MTWAFSLLPDLVMLCRVTLVYVIIVIAYGQWLLIRFYKVKHGSILLTLALPRRSACKYMCSYKVLTC